MARTRKPQSAPPSAGYVQALWRYKVNDGDEARLRQLASNFRVLTRLDHAIDIPGQYRATTKEVRTPFVRDAWERITASLTHNDWLLHYEPKGDSGTAKRASGVAERWVKAATNQMNHAVGEDVPYEATRAMVRDVESVIKVVTRQEAWATFPQRQKDEKPEAYEDRATDYKQGAPLPLAWRCVDRLSMLFEDGEFGDGWAIEYGEYPRPLLARQYGMREDADSGRLVGHAAGADTDRPVTPEELLGGTPVPGDLRSSTGSTVKIEYFDAEWWTVVIDGTTAPGFPKPNPYAPRLPYARAKPSAEPEHALYSLLFLVPALDALLTGWTNWAWLGMFPNPVLEDVPNSNAVPGSLLPPLGGDATPSRFEWRPGLMLEVPRGKKFGFMQPPPVGTDIKEMTLVLRGLIDIAGISPVFRGNSGSGDSGYLASQMTSAVEMLYRRLAAARARQLETAVDLMTYYIPTVIKTTVYVQGPGSDEGTNWLGLRAKGDVTDTMTPIDRLGAASVEVRPDMEVLKQARMMIAKQAIGGPPGQRLMSQRAAMEFVGDEDPETTMNQIWVEEQIASDPVVNQMIVADAMRQAKLFPAPPPSAAAGLVGPDGVTPLIPPGAGPPPAPGIPGQVSGGLPDLGALTAQPVPGGAGLPPGGPSGTFPGQPPNAPNVGA